jgi:hypothetical protein
VSRSLRFVVGVVVAAATVSLAWLTPVVIAGISLNGLD